MVTTLQNYCAPFWGEDGSYVLLFPRSTLLLRQVAAKQGWKWWLVLDYPHISFGLSTYKGLCQPDGDLQSCCWCALRLACQELVGFLLYVSTLTWDMLNTGFLAFLWTQIWSQILSIPSLIDFISSKMCSGWHSRWSLFSFQSKYKFLHVPQPSASWV